MIPVGKSNFGLAICARLTTAAFHVMSFGIKYLCAVAIKSPPNHRKTSYKCLLAADAL
jgi:hypothetical protein